MGLIRAGAGAVGSVFGDQWKEYFYCDALEQDVLARKGSKRTGKKSSNKGSDNIISNGSVIAVADGQCMLIVDQGRVVELCATPGEFVYDSSSEPSIFAGSLGQSIKDSFSTMAKRFTFGGDTAKDQRVYYVNTKEMGEVLYGTATPIPFRVVVNEELGFKLSVKLRCNGNFTYRVADPILFYTNVCGNVAEDFESETIEGKLKGELMTALQPALAKLSADRVMYYEIPAHTMDVAAALNDELSDIWRAKRGLEVVSFNINSLSIPEDQEKKITEWEENAMTMNQTVAASRLVGAQATAMKDAANNASGAMTGFMGMGMAMNQGGINAQNLYAAGAAAQPAPDPTPTPTPAPTPEAKADGWTCPTCGHLASGKFCPECGTPKPSVEGWACPTCGTVNKGKFCTECGAKKPAHEPLYRCDKCGWQPEDPHHPPKFCPECGDPFDDNDIEK